MAATPWDASWPLRTELAFALARLAAYLRRQRDRGRTAARAVPSVGLVPALAAPEAGGGPRAPAGFGGRPVVRDGLLEVEGEGPTPGLALRLASDLVGRLTAGTHRGPQSPGAYYHPAERG